MNHLRFLWLVLALAIVAVAVEGRLCRAQEVTVPRLDTSVCDKVQSQVNEIVAISESSSMTDAEKVRALSQAWKQSWNTMFERSQNDPEMAKMVKELGNTIRRVIEQGMNSPGSGNREVSDQTKQSLAALRNQIRPYLSIMKMLCPNLVMPPMVER